MKKLLTLYLLYVTSIGSVWGTTVDSLLRTLDANLINRHLYEKETNHSVSTFFTPISQFIHNGFVEDAGEALNAIVSNQLSPVDQADYYRCRILQYDYLYRLHRTDTLGYKYSTRQEQYQDSLLQILPEESVEKKYYEAIKTMKHKEYQTAYHQLEKLIDVCNELPWFFMAACEKMAEIDEILHRHDAAECNRIKRAIVAVKSNAKDYSGLIDAARIVMKRGDHGKASEYLDYAQTYALTSPSPLLAMELNHALAELRKTNLKQQVTEKHRLYFFFTVLSVMALVLLFSIKKINKQMHLIAQKKEKVDELYADLEKKNSALEQINSKLTNLTQQLQTTNAQLSEVSLLKDEYIGHFLKQCSEYLHKLQDYKKMANRKIQAGQIEELFKQNASNRMAQEESKELYRKFDIAFLKIFPHFVEQFNELLMPDERFILGKDELLNTELRLFALIRLGIKDSSQIADFLGYSVTTIYTYRTRIKNKAQGNRDEFEANVLKIGK